MPLDLVMFPILKLKLVPKIHDVMQNCVRQTHSTATKERLTHVSGHHWTEEPSMGPKSMSMRFTPVSSFLGVYECSAGRRQYGRHAVQIFVESANMILLVYSLSR